MQLLTTSDHDLEIAAGLLQDGGIVAFPTETVYGLGARADDATAVARIFSAKRRPEFDPLIVHVVDEIAAERVGEFASPQLRRLCDAFWPGPLTVVVKKHVVIPAIVTSGLDTVAIRVPSHPITRKLLHMAGVPIAAPSANSFGKLSPTCADHVLDDLGDAVDAILDGGRSEIGVESTIVEANKDSVLVHRFGGISLEAIREVLPDSRIDLSPVVANDSVAQRAPGKLTSHYAPRTPLRLVAHGAVFPVPIAYACALTFSIDGERRLGATHGFQEVHVLARDGDLSTAAAQLFEMLHDLDTKCFSTIYVELAPNAGIGRAINDRLSRGAACAEQA